MPEAENKTRLLLPQLRSFYDVAVPLSWLILRLGVAWDFLVHTWGKIQIGPSPGFLKAFADLGFTPPKFWFWTALTVEGCAAISIALGLFTRLFAAAAAIEMLVLTVTYWSNGFSWLKLGYEYVLLWGIVCFVLALRGGGPYSLDRKLGIEL